MTDLEKYVLRLLKETLPALKTVEVIAGEGASVPSPTDHGRRYYRHWTRQSGSVLGFEARLG